MSEILPPNSPGTLRVDTRKGWAIPNEIRKELPHEVLDAADEIVKQWAEKADMLRTRSNAYNCVGMVVASRRTWVDTAYLRRVLEDDGFRKLDNVGEARVGDVVVFYYEREAEPAHVGVVIPTHIATSASEDSLTVLSKWGPAGEYIHRLSIVPRLFGNRTEVWTDRRNV